MKLCGMHLSPYYERAYLVLEIKSAVDKVELAGMPGAFGSDELLAESPLGKIPYLLLDDGSCLPEGQVIAEYFNAIFDGPNLEHEHPANAARSLGCKDSRPVYSAAYRRSVPPDVWQGGAR